MLARCLTLLQTKIIFSEYLFCYCQKDFDMDARNNLKIIHTVDGAILQNRYGKAVIRSHDIGLISLPTGEIVMADPTLQFEIADFKRKAFQQKVSPGIYPVFAYSAHAGEDRTLAFAEIRFTDQPPVTFTAAKTICDAEQSSRRNCGYVVDELLEENLERWGINCAAGIAPNGDYSAALFTVPSGVYYWYWGKGQKGEICCLTADFFTYL